MIMFDFLQPLSATLENNPTFFIIFSVLFGMMVGSFLNVVVHRLPKMMDQAWHQNCLELQGKEVPEQPTYNIVDTALSLPFVQTSNFSHGKHSSDQLFNARRQV